MDQDTLLHLLDASKAIARRAGRAILEIASDIGDVQAKEDGSPLTRADRASHDAIEAGLATLQPPCPVISEEGDLADVDSKSAGVFWLVDPLDGTKEFVRGLGEYTVNIALIEQARPILGVIYVPASDALYYAADGAGAWKADPGRQPRQISANQCTQPTTAVVSRSHLSAETEEFLARIGVTDLARHGSSLKICAVAEGAADIYPRFGPTWLWDTAAGSAIAAEAGCVVEDLQGRPLTYDPAVGMKHAGFIVRPKSLQLASVVYVVSESGNPKALN